MGRPKAKDARNRELEKREKWKSKIRAKTHERLEPIIEMNEQKIIQVFLNRQKELGFNDVADATKTEFSRKSCNKYLKGLVEKGIIAKVRGKGKRKMYSLKLVPDRAVFQVRATVFLHQTLTNSDIALFNQRFGSLLTYTLKLHKAESLTILAPIISQVGAYINLPKMFMGEPVSVAEPKVESSEWDIWREFDKTESMKLDEFKKILQNMNLSPKG
jgi:hypothetical protein